MTTAAPQQLLFAPATLSLPSGVTGRIVKQVVDRGDWRIVLVQVDGTSEPERWAGVFPRPADGAIVEATGTHKPDRRGDGMMFWVEALIEKPPTTPEGIALWLADNIDGIGKATGRKIVAHFGMNVIEVLDADPSRIAEVPGLKPKVVEEIGKSWPEKRALAATTIYLLSIGVTPGIARRVVEKLGARARHVVEHDPYSLTEIDGIGFSTADTIAQKAGMTFDAPARIEAAIVHVLREFTYDKGHTYSGIDQVVRAAVKLAGIPADHVRGVIDGMDGQDGRVVFFEKDGETVMAAAGIHKAETRIAERLKAILAAPPREPAPPPDPAGHLRAVLEGLPAESRDMREHLTKRIEEILRENPPAPPPRPLPELVDEAIADFERESGMALAPAQREAVRLAAASKVLVITGAPGTGKSASLKAILNLFERGGLHVVLCAPTGRAAKRMNEATDHDAATIHRTLCWDARSKRFLVDEEHPLNTDVMVMDESSMVSVDLARDLLIALRDGTRVIFMGDVDQLPSIGPGAVLRDVIRSERVPTVRLTQIFRQAEGSEIVAQSQRVNRGEKPSGQPGPEGEFFVLNRSDGAAAADTVVEMVVNRIPSRFDIHPLDVQVLTPMHKGKAGTIALNRRLQDALNPLEPGASEIVRGKDDDAARFRVGDKVAQTKNDADNDVYNGDVGTVIAIEGGTEEQPKKTLRARFDGGREVTYDPSMFGNLTLAYAMSIHRSQGSTFQAVVQVMLTEQMIMLSRPLLYTGITRPRRLCVLVTDPRALRLALAETRREDRRTHLATLLATDS